MKSILKASALALFLMGTASLHAQVKLEKTSGLQAVKAKVAVVEQQTSVAVAKEVEVKIIQPKSGKVMAKLSTKAKATAVLNSTEPKTAKKVNAEDLPKAKK